MSLPYKSWVQADHGDKVIMSDHGDDGILWGA